MTDRAAQVAHDMQTPVAIILGLCARIEAGGLGMEQAADVERLRSQAAAIAQAAGSLIDPSGPARPPGEPVDAVRVAREVARDIRVLAGARGAHVVVVAGRPAFVRDDHDQLRSALVNLMMNAVRQVGEGGRVRCSVTSSGGTVTIEVADSGPGVPVADREAVLKPFAQGSGARGRAGLGLSIVRDAAAAMGGTIGIDAADEGGAAFRLAVPQARRASRRALGLRRS